MHPRPYSPYVHWGLPASHSWAAWSSPAVRLTFGQKSKGELELWALLFRTSGRQLFASLPALVVEGVGVSRAKVGLAGNVFGRG